MWVGIVVVSLMGLALLFVLFVILHDYCDDLRVRYGRYPRGFGWVSWPEEVLAPTIRYFFFPPPPNTVHREPITDAELVEWNKNREASWSMEKED